MPPVAAHASSNCWAYSDLFPSTYNDNLSPAFAIDTVIVIRADNTTGRSLTCGFRQLAGASDLEKNLIDSCNVSPTPKNQHKMTAGVP